MADLALKDLLDSKRYVNKNSNVKFMLAKDIIDPFLDSINYDEGFDKVTIKTQHPIVNENEDGSQNVAYPRFLVQVNKGASFADYDNTFGLIAAMDQGTPLLKSFSGQEARACLNLCIFNAEHIFQQNLISAPINVTIQMIAKYYKEKEQQIEQYRQIHTQLVETYYKNEELERQIGAMLLRSHSTDLGSIPVVGASRLLRDPKSKYYVKPGEDTSAYNVLNAITQNITDSSELFTKPNKTLAASRLMGFEFAN